MKELSTEQKAKAYDESLERAKKLQETCDSTTVVGWCEYIFPELKESDDERIRKEFCKDIRTFIPNEKANKYIAWLEKQKPVSITDEWIEDYWQHEKVINPCSYDKGEEIQFDHQGFVSFCKKYCKKPVERNKEDEKIRKSLINFLKSPFVNENITDEKVAPWIAWLEKQGKQTHAELGQSDQELSGKVEPKFHEGEWIANGGANPCYVKFIFEDNYVLCSCEGIEYTKPIIDVNYLYHLWSITDARDGDVVVDKSDGTIGIFQSIGHHPDGGSYNDHFYCFLYCRYDDGFFYADFENGNTINSNDLILATKEQRDLFFEKMKEAGYEWDAEKKKLSYKRL